MMVEDILARQITYQIVGSTGRGVCRPENSSICNITLAEEREGIYILEILVDGEQVGASPRRCRRQHLYRGPSYLHQNIRRSKCARSPRAESFVACTVFGDDP